MFGSTSGGFVWTVASMAWYCFFLRLRYNRKRIAAIIATAPPMPPPIPPTGNEFCCDICSPPELMVVVGFRMMGPGPTVAVALGHTFSLPFFATVARLMSLVGFASNRVKVLASRLTIRYAEVRK